ncbi:hypothetical protein L0244_03310 [bacterium]|nr:hypothetical protein [bacterium]
MALLTHGSSKAIYLYSAEIKDGAFSLEFLDESLNEFEAKGFSPKDCLAIYEKPAVEILQKPLRLVRKNCSKKEKEFLVANPLEIQKIRNLKLMKPSPNDVIYFSSKYMQLKFINGKPDVVNCFTGTPGAYNIELLLDKDTGIIKFVSNVVDYPRMDKCTFLSLMRILRDFRYTVQSSEDILFTFRLVFKLK